MLLLHHWNSSIPESKIAHLEFLFILFMDLIHATNTLEVESEI